jgi:lysophospholipase L1-like esterase
MNRRTLFSTLSSGLLWGQKEALTPLETVVSAMRPIADGIENVAALIPFFEQLHQSIKTPRKISVLHYGDSHTASDDWAHVLRSAFQQKFGNGGAGFVHAGRPFAGWKRSDVSAMISGRWLTTGTLANPGDGLHGLTGISLTAQRSDALVTITTAAQQVQAVFLQHPEGGTLELSSDTSPGEVIDTSGAWAPAAYIFQDSTGLQLYRARAASAGVRLLGWIAENKAGLTWEQFGINGATAMQHNSWEPTTVEAHLAQRNPALVLMAYGTNEAVMPKLDRLSYAASWKQTIDRIRRTAPQASILMVGPPDCYKPARGGWRPLVNLELVIDVQRQVARSLGCAFLDWRAHMGGESAMFSWVKAGLAQRDHLHLTKPGYVLLGTTMAAELMSHFAEFQRVRDL